MLRTFLPFLAAMTLAGAPAWAQQAPPPAVGVVEAARRPVTESREFIGRIEATDRVGLSARVTGFLEARLFTEGGEVGKGDLLFRLEQAPFKAEVQARQAAVRQVEAQLRNANAALERARGLLGSAAVSRAVFDNAQAEQQSFAAQLSAAQAQLRESEINLAYTEIRAPIDGTIGRSTVTEGNVVSPASGVLATIVSQDPMHVVFSVPVRTALELRQRVAREGSFDALRVRVRLPDGRLYEEAGRLDFIDNTVSRGTDTLTLRAVMPNPVRAGARAMPGARRELIDGELVSVLLEAAQPVAALTVPRAAVLSDQGGDFVYVVDGEGRARRRQVRLGQSTPVLAVVLEGLSEGERVVVEGLQRVRPGQPVAASTVSATPAEASGTGPGGSGAGRS